MLVDYIGDV